MVERRAKFWIGPAGWSYADWVGIVYPGRKLERAPHAGSAAELGTKRPEAPRFPRGFKPLEFIARYFNMVEVNSTFYRIPSPEIAEGWVRQTPADFRFTLKLPRSFTHQRADAPALDEVKGFRAVLGPIAAARKLGPLLIQFPWSFRFTPESVARLRLLRDLFAEYERFVEVRHASWNCEAGIAAVGEAGGWCNIDQPRLRDCITQTRYVLGRDGYVRLHGRNAPMWFANNVPTFERYNYLYSEDEIRAWVGHLNEMAAEAENVYVVANNHYRGQAVVNSLEIKALLSGGPVEAPATLKSAFPQAAQLVSAEKPRPVQQRLF